MSVFNGVYEEPQPQVCPSCDGKGVEECGATYTCLQCGGTGKVDTEGFMYTEKEPSNG